MSVKVEWQGKICRVPNVDRQILKILQLNIRNGVSNDFEEKLIIELPDGQQKIVNILDITIVDENSFVAKEA